ncbi:hypothetical protein A2572_01590 [Candidatus Collierbacteria bacterium RIFOXYD1_FULL_40_9]|uniref:Uncharacterized protein n=1 Tax=Candidatus Collierbacteria bacterium RIFOXYD1_FULL_40_9 TaxID=1817731 RepID=A0A1F5FUR2_9BACT|nr:MAG: hypothetical protein A2572_01590 [Candidatus Collierbacteria bacterium RIFOXYD1_FULL_40_9]
MRTSRPSSPKKVKYSSILYSLRTNDKRVTKIKRIDSVLLAIKKDFRTSINDFFFEVVTFFILVFAIK